MKFNTVRKNRAAAVSLRKVIARRPTLMGLAARQLGTTGRSQVTTFLRSLGPKYKAYAKHYSPEEIAQGIKRKGPEGFAKEVRLAFDF